MKKIIVIALLVSISYHLIAKNELNKLSLSNKYAWTPDKYYSLIKIKMQYKVSNYIEYTMALSIPSSPQHLKFLKSQNATNRFIDKGVFQNDRFQHINLNTQSILDKNRLLLVSKDIKIKS